MIRPDDRRATLATWPRRSRRQKSRNGYDTSAFDFWLQAHAAGNERAAVLFARRFRPEY